MTDLAFIVEKLEAGWRASAVTDDGETFHEVEGLGTRFTAYITLLDELRNL